MGCLSLQFLKACNVGSSKIKVMTVDGRCLKYVAPMIVKEVLMDHPLHALFDSETVRKQGNRARPLQGTLSLHPGHLYFLIPQPSRRKSVCGIFKGDLPCMRTTSNLTSLLQSDPAQKRSTHTRKVSFADAPTETLISAGSMESMPLTESSVQILPSPCDGVIRLKMVVSKRQLAGVLKEGGDCVSMVEGLLSPLLRASRSDTQSALSSSCNDLSSSCSWRPSLESIPESARCP